MGRTRLVKTPFLADLLYYNLSGEFITGDTYIVRESGPVGKVAGELTKNTNAYLSEITKVRGGYERRYYIPINTPDCSFYSSSKMMMLNASRIWTRRQPSTDDRSDLSHCLRMWDRNKLGHIIPENEFVLTHNERNMLEKDGGIIINNFGQDFCHFSNHLIAEPTYFESNNLEKEIISYTRDFPMDVWGDYEDCFLASLDALRETVRAKLPDSTSNVADTIKSMTAVLAFSSSMADWVVEKTNYLTALFDDISMDAAKAGDMPNTIYGSALDSILEKMRENALNSLHSKTGGV